MTEAPDTPGAGLSTTAEHRSAYVVFILFVVFTLNFVDRQIINVLAEPIRRDLGLTDLQLGLLTGLAFALLYTVLGIPIARLADRSNRVRIIAVSVGLWSLMTALCGGAQSFLQLFLARVGVGIGEAGCTPPAHSLISDYVVPERRARAMAAYALGIPVGTVIGLALGGWVAQAYGWRAAFVIVGLPGVLLAVVVALTVRDPRPSINRQDAPSLSHTLRVMFSKPSFLRIGLAGAFAALVSYGLTAFLPALFVRRYGWSLSEVGLGFGLMIGLASLVGTWMGGWACDLARRWSPRAYVLVPAVATGLSAPFFIFALSMEEGRQALAWLAIPTLLNAVWYGPIFAAVQAIAPSAMRATASAIFLFTVNLIGLGLGPVVIGWLSDLFADRNLASCAASDAACRAAATAEGLVSASIVVALGGLVAAVIYVVAGSTLRQDLEATT